MTQTKKIFNLINIMKIVTKNKIKFNIYLIAKIKYLVI
jgi:hypothetical protein